MAYYRANRYEYFVVDHEKYARYHREEVAFYRELFAEGQLLEQFRPTLTRGGSLLSIYRLGPNI